MSSIEALLAIQQHKTGVISTTQFLDRRSEKGIDDRSLEAAHAYLSGVDREYGDLGFTGPVSFQGGVIFLQGYGCRACGHGHWVESDSKRNLTQGELYACAHCGEYSRVPVSP